MPNQTARQLMIENLQDSLRLVRHLMEFGVEEFAEAIGVTRQTVNNLETKKTKMSATQYIAIAALVDNYFAQNERMLPALKAILDSDGKDYGEEYETAFRGDSLLRRWFEDFIDFPDDEELTDNDFEDFSDDNENPLWDLAQDYKIFIDAELLKTAAADDFVFDLMAALDFAEGKAVIPLRSIEQLKAETTPEEFAQATDFIQQMNEHEVLQIFGEETDSDFRNTILTVFERFRNKYHLCLITPDESLAREVLKLNHAEDALGIAAAFVEDGMLKFYVDEELSEEEVTAEEQKPVADKPDTFSGWSEL